MEVLQISDDSSDEAGSDLEIYVPSNARDGGTFDFSLWGLFVISVKFSVMKKKKKIC